jgi:hypothetical protein
LEIKGGTAREAFTAAASLRLLVAAAGVAGGAANCDRGLLGGGLDRELLQLQDVLHVVFLWR